MTGGVTIRGLTKRYGPTVAVDGLDLDAAAGAITGLLGRNGAGKTTTLECLLGLRSADAGTITVDGLDAVADRAAVKPRVGAQLQATALQDQITPRQAVRFFASFYRTARKPDDLLGRFDLTAKADVRYDTLTTGQRQRLALALAVVNDPPVLVLDEPTAGLDPHGRRELHSLIAGLRDEGRTVLLSTHDIAEAERVCDHVIIIDGGRAIAAGSPAALSAGDAVTVVVRTDRPLAEVADPSIMRADRLADGWQMATTDVARCVAAIASAAVAAGVGITDLAVRRPSLEEAFIRLTTCAG